MKPSYIDNPQQWKDEFHFFVEVTVRFSETDMFGHLNNTVPFAYFEYARIEYLKSFDFMNEWMSGESELIPVVADLHCDYVKQVFFDEKLRVFVKTASIGKSSLDLHYLAKNENDETCFMGRGTIVQIDKRTGKAIPLREVEKEKILHGK